ncbi:MAG: Nramp family divalent metal transporter [bacterium]
MSDTNRPAGSPVFKKYLAFLGPGIAIAATGVGAGDMVTATVAGSKYGFAVIWAAVVGALLKGVLNEGLARWQLATGTTLLEGWVQRLGSWVQLYFLVYLVLWSFVVGAALISACGLAAHAIAPALSVEVWGVLHSLGAVLVVLFGGYQYFERLMKLFIGIMFITILGCAFFVASPTAVVTQSISAAAIPAGSAKFILGIIGGVGGSLTLLAYGYWIRERQWHGSRWKAAVRFDLTVSYVLTGLFGVALMVLASKILYARGASIEGSEGVLHMATILSEVIGPIGHWAFLVGFWGAVTTSMIGVWQGVPYMFCDFVGLMKKLTPQQQEAIVNTRSVWYRGYLFWLAIPPLAVLLLGRPVWIIVVYSVIGALFMPFLAATLLYMNSKTEWVGQQLKNGWLTISLLVVSLVLFGYLCFAEILKFFK